LRVAKACVVSSSSRPGLAYTAVKDESRSILRKPHIGHVGILHGWSAYIEYLGPGSWLHYGHYPRVVPAGRWLRRRPKSPTLLYGQFAALSIKSGFSKAAFWDGAAR